jgi:L-lactate utilization protein LutB
MSKNLKTDIQKFVKNAVRKRLARGIVDSTEAKSMVAEIIELLSYLEQSVPPVDVADPAVEETEGDLDGKLQE